MGRRANGEGKTLSDVVDDIDELLAMLHGATPDVDDIVLGEDTTSGAPTTSSATAPAPTPAPAIEAAHFEEETTMWPGASPWTAAAVAGAGAAAVTAAASQAQRQSYAAPAWQPQQTPSTELQPTHLFDPTPPKQLEPVAAIPTQPLEDEAWSPAATYPPQVESSVEQKLGTFQQAQVQQYPPAAAGRQPWDVESQQTETMPPEQQVAQKWAPTPQWSPASAEPRQAESGHWNDASTAQWGAVEDAQSWSSDAAESQQLVAMQTRLEEDRVETVGEAQLQQLGIRPAPEYGHGMFVTSMDQLEHLLDVKMQKAQVTLKALKRYVETLENDLDTRDAELDGVHKQLQEEQRLRTEAEAERDSLKQQRASLEAKLVDETQAQWDAEREMEEMDRMAEINAERVSRGEISEEEAARTEEELIHAQARQHAAQESRERGARELVEVTAAAEEAERRANAASAAEDALRQQLQAQQREMDRIKAERDADRALREKAEAKLQTLFDRLKSKAAARSTQ